MLSGFAPTGECGRGRPRSPVRSWFPGERSLIFPHATLRGSKDLAYGTNMGCEGIETVGGCRAGFYLSARVRHLWRGADQTRRRFCLRALLAASAVYPAAVLRTLRLAL